MRFQCLRFRATNRIGCFGTEWQSARTLNWFEPHVTRIKESPEAVVLNHSRVKSDEELRISNTSVNGKASGN